MQGAIIIGGKKHVLDNQPVHTWHDTGLTFDDSKDGGAERRTMPIKGIVLHATASVREGDEGARTIHASLLNRRTPLSVEFFVDEAGCIYQFVDPMELRCRHASRVNPFTIGVEVSGYLWDKPGRRLPQAMDQHPTYQSPPLASGWKPKLYDYRAVQQFAVNHLCMVLCRTLGIPLRVLGEPWERRPRGFFSSWEGGVCGHIHCASLRVRHPKIDPGPAPLIDVARHFEENRV